ncbi:MAG TPA: tetratricopeptide repeat protein [Candidatus Dormibacteraeota bacterium]|nr:tetratricopeptide repeat protein [Candidatus Dormibacteraeota bacterium]
MSYVLLSMSLNFIWEDTTSLRFWTFFFLLVRLSSAGLASAGQAAPPATAKNSAIETHFTAAQRAQRSKDYSTAVREYQAVLVLAPGFAEVHMNLGLVYQLQDRFIEAMAEFHHALKIKPGLAGADFFLGVDYCKLGEGAKAIPYLKAALETEPDRLETWLWLATAQEMSGQLQAEVVTLHRALDLRSNDEDALYLLGSAYERLGKQEVAYLEKVAPGSSRSEQLLAESYAASSEWPSAVIRFQNAIVASPDRAGLHAELAEVLLRVGKVNQSIQESDEELRRNPGNLRALVRRGEASLIKGNVDAALQDWDKALTLDAEQAVRILGLRETGFGDSAIELLPEANREQVQQLAQVLRTRNSRPAHLALAFLAEQNGNLSQAATESSIAAPGTSNSAGNNCTETDANLAIQQDEFSEIVACTEKILASRPSAEIRIRVSGALLEAGHSDAALKALEGLSAADSGSAEAAFWRARCYEKLATAAYLQIYQAHPSSYRVHQLMGDLESARGNDAKAIEEYREAIVLKPSVPNLHYSLGHLLWKDLTVPQARLELEAELKMNPRHAGALNDLGNTYLLEHQPSKALPYLLRALAADSGNSDIHRDLGTAYSELHDYRRAAENFKIAVTTDHDGSVHYKLAKVYQALGEKEQAAREFALSSALNRESHDKLERQTQRLGEVTKSTEDP